MKNVLYIISLLLFISCVSEIKSDEKNLDEKQYQPSSIQEKLQNLKDSKNKEIIVVAHRADWRNAPENSLQAIQNCIDMGVDMVEIDIWETKDNQLVIIHDPKIDRTMTGKGYVKDWTLDSLKALFLKDGLGKTTPHKIPTLKEVLELTKDKILVNLDKSYKIFDKCYEVIEETGTQDQVIIKGNKERAQVEKEFGYYLDKVHFMPVVNLSDPNVKRIVNEYLSLNSPLAIEFVFKNDTSIDLVNFSEMRENGTSVWVNSLWPELCGGHDDEKAALDLRVYDWYIDNAIDIIQTDRPELLIKYLRSKKLHD